MQILILFSPIVLGELMFGFRNDTRFEKNMAELNRFLAHEAVELAPIGDITADRYARIAARLKQCATPIPSNDIWILTSVRMTGMDGENRMIS